MWPSIQNSLKVLFVCNSILLLFGLWKPFWLQKWKPSNFHVEKEKKYWIRRKKPFAKKRLYIKLKKKDKQTKLQISWIVVAFNVYAYIKNLIVKKRI